MYRPSPQVSQPSPRAALICFESAASAITLSQKHIESGVIDITWVFVLNLNVSVSTLLWTTSYPEVRQTHPREEVESLVNTALECQDRCAERWIGTTATSQLYTIFSKACLQSYDARAPNDLIPAFSFASPPPGSEQQSSPESYAQSTASQMPYMNPPQFGYVFDSPPESMNAYAFDPNFPPPQPSFRSNSIFCNPATDNNGRRFSYFPPDFTQMGEAAPDDPSQHIAAPDQMPNHLPTPPESLAPGNMSSTPRTTLSPPGMSHHTPNMSAASPVLTQQSMQKNMSPPRHKPMLSQVAHGQPPQAYGAPRIANPVPQQRPLPPTPTSMSEWFTPPPQFISPYNFGSMGNSFFNEAMQGGNHFNDGHGPGLGLQNIAASIEASGAPYGYLPGRQGSLSHSQQIELMNVLETEGVGDMEAFLSANVNMGENRWY